VRVGEGT